MNTSQSTQDFISYQYKFSTSFIIVLLAPLLIGAGMLWVASDYNALSPYITTPQSLLDDNNLWVYGQCLPDGSKSNFFTLDMFFPFSVAILLGYIFSGFLFQSSERKTDVEHSQNTNIAMKLFTIEFNWSKFKNIFLNLFGEKSDKTGDEEEEDFHRSYRWVKRFFIISLIGLIGFDLWENILYCKNYDDPITGDRSFLKNIANTKVIFYGIAIFFTIFTITYRYLKNHFIYNRSIFERLMDQLRGFIKYFYPAIISLFFLGIIFNTYSAFDSLVVDMLASFNFVLFTTLFAFTLLMIWFIPYYLRFSNVYYEKVNLVLDRHRSDENSYQDLKDILFSKWNLFLPVGGILTKEYKDYISPNVNEYKSIWDFHWWYELGIFEIRTKIRTWISTHVNKEGEPNDNRKVIEDITNELSKPNNLSRFHITRRAIAVLFILILLWLVTNAFANVIGQPKVTTMVIAFELIVLLLYISSYLKCIIQPTNIATGKKGKILDKHLNRTKSIVPIQFILTASYAVYILYLYFGDIPKEQYWVAQLGFLIILVMLLPFSFLRFTLYRRVTKNYVIMKNKDEEHQTLNDKYKNWNLFSTTFFMPVYFLISSVCIFLFFINIRDINAFNSFNPFNVFLFALNSIIVLIALIDRNLILSKNQKISNVEPTLIKDTYEKISDLIPIKMPKLNRKKVEHEHEKTGQPLSRRIIALTLASLFIVYLIFPTQNENHYHDIEYISYPENFNHPVSNIQYDYQKLPNLAEYTQRFLNSTNPDDPIILIASDGGGLRAAYWTTLILNKLNREAPNDFFKNTFLTTGVSGGSIGLSLMSYMKANDYSPGKIDTLCQRIGRGNYLSSDLWGIIGKSTLAWLLPSSWNLSDWQDRMEAMSEHYFNEFGNDVYKELRTKPFASLWVENDYKLPIQVINTARSEDGKRGVIHPLKYNSDSIRAYVDLSRNNKGEHITFPDASFTTNRFPVASPAAKIEDKGHFVDGGYLENTGLSTVLYYLQRMYMEKNGADSISKKIFTEFFDRKIIVISISNDKSTYIKNQFKFIDKSFPEDLVNKVGHQGSLGAILGAAANTGLTALPSFYQNLFSDKSFHNLFAMEKDKFDFVKINLPYRITADQVHKINFGQIQSCGIKDSVDVYNKNLIDFYSKATGVKPISVLKEVPVVMPPLNRIITESSLNYMDVMVDYGKNGERLDSILSKF